MKLIQDIWHPPLSSKSFFANEVSVVLYCLNSAGDWRGGDVRVEEGGGGDSKANAQRLL